MEPSRATTRHRRGGSRSAAQPTRAGRADPGADRIIDAIRRPVVLLDEKLRVIFANRAFYREFNIMPEETIGQHLAEIGDHRLDVTALRTFLGLVQAEDAAIEDYEIEIELPALGRRVLLLSAEKIRKEAEATREIVVAIDDVTERKRAETTLKSAKWHAERANLSKSRFLAAASHDLRQPLQTLSLTRGVLTKKIKEKKNEEALELVARLDETAGGLSRMLDTLLDINQLEAGNIHPQKVNSPIDDLLERLHLIRFLLAESRRSTARAGPLPRAESKGDTLRPTIFVVDDESSVRDAMRGLLEEEGWAVEVYASGEAFLDAYRPGREGCLVVDARMPRMSGLDLLERLKTKGGGPPAIMITGHADIRLAVRAMKAGAMAFLEKPVQYDELVVNIERALELTRNSTALSSLREAAARRIAGLTSRERQVVEMVVEGNPNKQVAYVLGISQRTVETHRATAMKKIGARTLSELIHLTIAGSPHDA
ncbi:MAG TPA: response regulator [Candidatus Binataceae bacterium]|nr:response regulator [Candidatus Binataceae bacterium]